VRVMHRSIFVEYYYLLKDVFQPKRKKRRCEEDLNENVISLEKILNLLDKRIDLVNKNPSVLKLYWDPFDDIRSNLNSLKSTLEGVSREMAEICGYCKQGHGCDEVHVCKGMLTLEKK